MLGHFKVAVAAPTGLAAKGVKGMTLHALFKLDVKHGGEAAYNPLNPKNLSLAKTMLGHKPLLLMIDEVSMVSNLMLTKIHMRLCEIFGERSIRKFFPNLFSKYF